MFQIFTPNLKESKSDTIKKKIYEEVKIVNLILFKYLTKKKKKCFMFQIFGEQKRTSDKNNFNKVNIFLFLYFNYQFKKIIEKLQIT